MFLTKKDKTELLILLQKLVEADANNNSIDVLQTKSIEHLGSSVKSLLTIVKIQQERIEALEERLMPTTESEDNVKYVEA